MTGILAVIRPRLPGGIGAWVRAQRVLITTSQNATYAGRHYDFDLFPVVSRLVFPFMEDPDCRELFVEKPTQTAFTTAVFFATAWRLAHDPGNVIYVMDTRDKAREKLRDSFGPILKAIPELASARAEAETESTSTAFRFAGGALYIGGGQSSATLNSTPAVVVILDEAERHPLISDTSTIALGRSRLTGADTGKLLAFSKPELEARFERNLRSGALDYVPLQGTYLDAEFLSGTQERYVCPCPACGLKQELVWEQIKFHHCNTALPGLPAVWDQERILRETHYACIKCGHVIHEGAEKKAWIRAGEWQPTPPDERRAKEKYPQSHPGRRSARMSALTDIAFRSLEWGKLALRWLECQGDSVKLRDFFNAILGLPEPVRRSTSASLEQVRRLIPSKGSTDPAPWNMFESDGVTPTRNVPLLASQVDYVGMTCDVQQGCVKFRCRAHGKDGRSYLVDYGRLPDLEDIPRYIAETLFETLDGASDRVFQCFIDVGYRYWDVLELTAAHPDIITGIKGEGLEIRMRGEGICWPIQANAKSGSGIIEYWMIAAGYWERQLYVERIKYYDPDRHRHHAPAMYFPADVGDEYLAELTKMHEVQDGRVLRWKKIHKEDVNDWGDCEKYGLVMDHIYGCRHRNRELRPSDAAAATP